MSELKEVSDEEQEGSAKKKVKLSEKLKSIPLSSGKQMTTGDKASYQLLSEIIYSAVKPVKFSDKLNIYKTYIIVGIVFFIVLCFAYWDALTLRGGTNFYLGVATGAFFIIPVVFYFLEIRPKTAKYFPLWTDVNTANVLNFQKIGEDEGYEIVAPFYEKNGSVFRPPNPYDAARPLLISVDQRCVRKNDRGMVTLGKIFHDNTGKTTFRVEIDESFVPSPDTINLAFELKMSNLRIEGYKRINSEIQTQLNRLRGVKVTDEVNRLFEYLNRMIPLAGQMSRSGASEDLLVELVRKINTENSVGGGPRVSYGKGLG